MAEPERFQVGDHVTWLNPGHPKEDFYHAVVKAIHGTNHILCEAALYPGKRRDFHYIEYQGVVTPDHNGWWCGRFLLVKGWV